MKQFEYNKRHQEADWKGKLKEISDRFSLVSFNKTFKQKVSSDAQHKRWTVLFLAFNELREGDVKYVTL